MPITEDIHTGAFRLHTPGPATVSRIAGWVGEAHGESSALGRCIRISARIGGPRATERPRQKQRVVEQLAAELRGTLFLPPQLRIPEILHGVCESIVEIHIGLFRHPDEQPPTEYESDEEIPGQF